MNCVLDGLSLRWLDFMQLEMIEIACTIRLLAVIELIIVSKTDPELGVVRVHMRFDFYRV